MKYLPGVCAQLALVDSALLAAVDRQDVNDLGPIEHNGRVAVRLAGFIEHDVAGLHLGLGDLCGAVGHDVIHQALFLAVGRKLRRVPAGQRRIGGEYSSGFRHAEQELGAVDADALQSAVGVVGRVDPGLGFGCDSGAELCLCHWPIAASGTGVAGWPP